MSDALPNTQLLPLQPFPDYVFFKLTIIFFHHVSGVICKYIFFL